MRFVFKIIALAALPVASAFAASQATVLDIQNMTCGLCGVTVKQLLQKVPGVEDVTIDYSSKTATVQYDASKATVAAMTKATTDGGFPSTPRK